MLNGRLFSRIRARQRGASAVEFGIIAMLFFSLFFGIIEFGRFFYLYNTVQEVTRCAARQAVVTWTDDWYTDDPGHKPPIIPIPRQCLFGHDELVAGWEIKGVNVRLRALNLAYGNVADDANPPASVGDNIANCVNPTASNCIRFVEARLCSGSGCDLNPTDPKSRPSGIAYQPTFGLIPLNIVIPSSIVLMPAESLGYSM